MDRGDTAYETRETRIEARYANKGFTNIRTSHSFDFVRYNHIFNAGSILLLHVKEISVPYYSVDINFNRGLCI